MTEIRNKLRHPRVILFSLAVSVLVIASAVLVVLAIEHENGELENRAQYPPWESAQLFSFPGNWDDVSPTTVYTTYPLQTSLQRMLRDPHLGSESVAAGTSCAACHGNAIEEQSSVAGWAGPPTDHYQSGGCVACHGSLERDVTSLGQSLVNREFAGEFGPGYKPGSIEVDVRAAYDEEYFYIRLQWPSERPGISHDLFRFDGNEWVSWGGPKPDVDREDRLPSYEDRITINIAPVDIPAYDGATASFGSIGCYIGCHDSQREMPLDISAEEVEAHPYFGEGGLGESDIRKYLLVTREELDETGGWDSVRSVEELEALMESGHFLDMWMWRASRGGPLGVADDNYVLEYRLGDAGGSAFATQGVPLDFMYDEDVTGFRAIPEDQFEELLTEFPMIIGENTAPFDPEIEWQEGDILPRRVLREPDGSRADILAYSRWEDGNWIVVMRRALDTGNDDDVQLRPGRLYTIGIAVFDDHVSNRYHHVSFPVTIGIGVEADIVTVQLDEQD